MLKKAQSQKSIVNMHKKMKKMSIKKVILIKGESS